jgi:pyruvate kinase
METLDQVVEAAQQIALSEGFGVEGEQVVVTAGVPFGQVGQTNLLRLLRL